ncbi:hypothetical protein VP01_64g3 [Puccinia sorghi]|uniref:Uncharacterized protein n=1 Tax=Puccinia sorghi TaxID=27349 RepID=A0A0L6UGD9_9BASI|nr:hypothetical protein VP01_64g3 [Puccinia sorghi]
MFFCAAEAPKPCRGKSLLTNRCCSTGSTHLVSPSSIMFYKLGILIPWFMIFLKKNNHQSPMARRKGKCHLLTEEKAVMVGMAASGLTVSQVARLSKLPRANPLVKGLLFFHFSFFILFLFFYHSPHVLCYTLTIFPYFFFSILNVFYVFSYFLYLILSSTLQFNTTQIFVIAVPFLQFFFFFVVVNLLPGTVLIRGLGYDFENLFQFLLVFYGCFPSIFSILSILRSFFLLVAVSFPLGQSGFASTGHVFEVDGDLRSKCIHKIQLVNMWEILSKKNLFFILFFCPTLVTCQKSVHPLDLINTADKTTLLKVKIGRKEKKKEKTKTCDFFFCY